MLQKILIIAAEVSGDRHAARLVKALREKSPELEFVGVGGRYLEEVGVPLIARSTDKGTFGFVEVLRYVPAYLSMLRTIKKAFKTYQPDLVITVDAQGFNMSVAAAAKKAGLPVAYYIAPQEWHWGTEKGGRKVVAVTDLILSIFQPEYEFYNRLGGNAVLIGHPLLDLIEITVPEAELRKELGISPTAKILTVLPGSRHQELTRLYPVLLKAALKTQAAMQDTEVVVSLADPSYRSMLDKLTKSLTDKDQRIHFYEGNSYNMMAAADFSFSASGTATLEQTLLGTPTVVAAKLHPISYWIAKKLYGKVWDEKIKFVTLPNILTGRLVMPEFLQDAATAEALSEVAIGYLKDEQKLKAYKADLETVRPLLGESGGVDRAATAIMSKFNLEKE